MYSPLFSTTFSHLSGNFLMPFRQNLGGLVSKYWSSQVFIVKEKGGNMSKQDPVNALEKINFQSDSCRVDLMFFEVRCHAYIHLQIICQI